MKWLFLLLVVASSSAQRFDVVSGKLDALKDITAYNVVFDYQEMKIHGYESEAAFLKDKMDKRDPEKAAKFQADWYADRQAKYEPRFIAYFNKRFEKSEFVLATNPKERYTMLVKTTWLYPGYGIGIGGEPAKISATISVYETENPSNVLFVIAFEKSIGLEDKNYNSPGERISGAYEKLAKNLVMQFKRLL